MYETGRKFLIETGVEVRVFPANNKDYMVNRSKSKIELLAANGSIIPTHEYQKIPTFFSETITSSELSYCSGFLTLIRI